jgi:hypothetical protein
MTRGEVFGNVGDILVLYAILLIYIEIKHS